MLLWSCLHGLICIMLSYKVAVTQETCLPMAFWTHFEVWVEVKLQKGLDWSEICLGSKASEVQSCYLQEAWQDSLLTRSGFSIAQMEQRIIYEQASGNSFDMIEASDQQEPRPQTSEPSSWAGLTEKVSWISVYSLPLWPGNLPGIHP